MWRKFAEVSAAALTALALLGSHVRGDETKECLTLQTVEESLGNIKPTYDLKGEELAAFKHNYTDYTGNAAPPESDEVVVFGKTEDPDNQLLFLSFGNGCARWATKVPAGVFLQILNGHKA